MSHYRRSLAKGATFFFTANLADRKSDLLIREIARLREAYRRTKDRYPFKTIAICIMPDHLHAVWQLPEDDADFGRRWGSIKRFFQPALMPTKTAPQARSKSAKKEYGSGGFGSTRFEMMSIYNGMSITCITTR
jgi:putative transposase